jgi:hypothetical protein
MNLLRFGYLFQHKLKALVLDSVSSPITKRVYNLGLDEFFVWYAQEPPPGLTRLRLAPMNLTKRAPRHDSGPSIRWRSWYRSPAGYCNEVSSRIIADLRDERDQLNEAILTRMPFHVLSVQFLTNGGVTPTTATLLADYPSVRP